MKVSITTDQGEVLEIVDGKICGASDAEILKTGQDGTDYDLPGIVKDAVENEITAMVRRGKPA